MSKIHSHVSIPWGTVNVSDGRDSVGSGWRTEDHISNPQRRKGEDKIMTGNSFLSRHA